MILCSHCAAAAAAVSGVVAAAVVSGVVASDVAVASDVVAVSGVVVVSSSDFGSIGRWHQRSPEAANGLSSPRGFFRAAKADRSYIR